MTKSKATTIDEYIKAAPPETREMLEELRAILKKLTPKASEAI